MITLQDYITASGKYPERARDPECTSEVRKNAEDLLLRVNGLLAELGVNARVSSGFRPSQVNAKIKTAARKSKHLKGLAIDLEDWKEELDQLFMLNLPLLEKFGYISKTQRPQRAGHTFSQSHQDQAIEPSSLKTESPSRNRGLMN